MLGPGGEWLTSEPSVRDRGQHGHIAQRWSLVTIRGLSMGKWVHKIGGILMLTTFAMLIALPWLNVAHGTLPAFIRSR